MNREFIELDADNVIVKSRFRKEPGDLATLENSIRNLGLLVPVIVDRNNVLISGGRRLEACRRAGVGRIPVLRLDTSYDSLAALDIQVDKNLCRRPLTGEELEQLIRRKKAKIEGKPRKKEPGGALARLKRLFTRT